MCDLTHSWIIHDLSVCVASLIHTCPSYVRHSTLIFVCVSSHIRNCDMPHSNVWRDLSIHVTWLIRMLEPRGRQRFRKGFGEKKGEGGGGGNKRTRMHRKVEKKGGGGSTIAWTRIRCMCMLPCQWVVTRTNDTYTLKKWFVCAYNKCTREES